MIKKHLLGGALFVSVLVLLTGCKEMMSSLDNPVSAYFEVTPTQATIAKNQTCQISYSTISDGKVTFKSSAENIATVDANGLVTAKTAGTAIITVELAATPYYQGATKNVEISVDAVLSIDATEVTVGYGASINLVKDYHLARKGDATINYEIIEGGEFITLDETTKDITGKVCGDAKVKVSVPASATASSDELVIDVKARVQDLDQLKKVIAASDDVTALLSDEKIITIDESLDLSGKKVTLKGDEKKLAKITLSKSFVIYDNFTLKNVKIDASGVNDKAVFLMSSSPTLTQNSKSCYEVEEVNFEGVTVTGIQQRFFYDNKKAYVVKNFKVNNCVIGLATVATESDIEGAIEFNAGGILEFDIENSTVYQTSNLNVKYFTKYNNSKVPDNAIADYTACTFWTYKNNTFYKVAKEHWHNGGRISQKASTMTVDIENNIWVDCATNGSGILRRMFGGKKSTDFKKATISLNTYWLNGAAEDNSGYDQTESPTPLTTDPDFVNAPTNFKPQGEKQVTNQTGDPRWYKTN